VDNWKKTKFGQFIWVYLWGTFTLVFAFIPLIVLNLLQFPSLLLLPISRPAYRAYNRVAASLIWGWWAWAAQNLVGMKINVLGDDVPVRENAIVFSNHQSMSDIIIIISLALRKGRIGDVKWMVKDVLKYIPGLGWGLMFLGCIFLKRNWMDDEKKILKMFERYTTDKIPIWMTSFPEGTRITPAKHEDSQAFAKKMNLKPLKHVLFPRTKGFIASVHGLKNHVKAIYSLTIEYPGERIPTLIQAIRGDVAVVNLHVKRHPIEAVPKDDDALAAWLTEQFYEKDRIMQRL
jgi:1-acyl-sn-glycerol-3-phosphate acyltransferase